MLMTDAVFHVAAILLLGAGAVTAYLASPRQQLVARPWPSRPCRYGALVLLVTGTWAWGRVLQPASAIFAAIIVAMVLLTALPVVAALWTSRGKK